MHKKYRYIIPVVALLLCVVCQRMIGKGVHTQATRDSSATTAAIECPRQSAKTPQQIIRHIGYTVSHNPQWKIPNWVAYALTKEETQGSVPREDSFYPDPKVKGQPVVHRDYTHSGYDRGHMAPAADMKWSEQAMRESFYMTNICPQNHNLNRGDWKELEDACRRWAEIEPVYIACGPILYKVPKYGYIGKEHQIRIPDAFFKVVLTGLQSGNPRAVGFIYKNEAGNYKRDKYVNSIDEVERITSFDFFSELPDDVEETIEAEYDLDEWS